MLREVLDPRGRLQLREHRALIHRRKREKLHARVAWHSAMVMLSKFSDTGITTNRESIVIYARNQFGLKYPEAAVVSATITPTLSEVTVSATAPPSCIIDWPSILNDTDASGSASWNGGTCS